MVEHSRKHATQNLEQPDGGITDGPYKRPQTNNTASKHCCVPPEPELLGAFGVAATDIAGVQVQATISAYQ